MRKLKILMVASAAAMLSSCDLSQIPGMTGKLSLEDSKAVGAACRHSGRALEDCFALNPTSTQAGVFEGWREMNDYMLANEIEVVKPEISNSAYALKGSDKDHDGHEAAHAANPDGNKAGSPAGSGEAAPPVAGRQRWTPRGAADPSSQASSSAAPADSKPASGQHPGAGQAQTQAREETAPEAPARPWERKKDPKKHT